MARAPKSQPEGEQESPPLPSVQITYVPREGDPPSVKWNRHVFHANVPHPVTDTAMIESARGNKWFVVGDFDPNKDSVAVEETGLPKTPEQYRAHAIAWLQKMQSVEELDTRWTAEETLRMACGVGSDDIAYLATFHEAKRYELRKRELAG